MNEAEQDSNSTEKTTLTGSLDQSFSEETIAEMSEARCMHPGQRVCEGQGQRSAISGSQTTSSL